MSKKVNWKDKTTIEQAVQKSTSYAETLKTLGLKPVSANTSTLKKYIAHHAIDTTHFDTGVIKVKVLTDEERNDDIPRVEIVGEVLDPHKGVGIELDWNDAFVRFLRDNGYTGASDDAVVQYYITHLAQNIAEQMETGKSEFEG